MAAWAAWQSRESAHQANVAASTLAMIEQARRHGELAPRFQVIVEPWNTGMDVLRLRVMLTGPSTLECLDDLTVWIRNDHFRRGEGQSIAGGPTREQIRQQIWGPYMFAPGVGPDGSRTDEGGWTVEVSSRLPLNEELLFQLVPTRPGAWMTSTTLADWRAQCGNVIRMAITGTRRTPADLVFGEVHLMNRPVEVWDSPFEITLDDTGHGSAMI